MELEEINLSFPKSLYFKNFYIEDDKKDTLLFAGKVFIDIDMMTLFKNAVIIHSFSLENATVHINRTLPDSSYNFDFIVNAFSSDSPAPVTADSAGTMNIILDNASFKDVLFTYHDSVSGSNMDVKIGSLSAPFRSFNFNEKKFIAGDLEIKNSNISIVNTLPASSASAPASSPFEYQIGAKKILVNNVNFFYADSATHIRTAAAIGICEVRPGTIDLDKQIFKFEKIDLENSSGYFSSIKDTSVSTTVSSADSTVPLNISVKGLTLKGFNYSYDIRNAPFVQNAVDYNHLGLKDVNTQIQDISFEGTNISANIKNLSAQDKSGFELKSLTALISMTETGFSMKNFLAETGSSRIGTDVAITYPSIESITNNPGEMGMAVTLKNSRLSIRDLLMVYPALKENQYVVPNQNRTIFFSGQVKGKLNNFSFSNFDVRPAYNTELAAFGSVRGLPDVNHALFDITISKLSSTNADVASLLPENSLPPTLDLPEKFLITGNFKGSVSDFHSYLTLSGSDGSASAEVTMKPSGGKVSHYSITAKTDDFYLGQIIRQKETIGTITMQADINGEGFSLEDLNTTINATISKIDALDYTYHNITINGKIANQFFNGDASINDSAIAFKFAGAASLNQNDPNYNFDLDVGYADLRKLNFYKEDLLFSGKINGDFTGNDLRTLNGSIQMDNGILAHNGIKHPLGPVYLDASTRDSMFNLDLLSAILSAHYLGNIPPTQGISALIQHFNYYFNKDNYIAADTFGNPRVDFAASIFDQQKLIPVFVPGFQSLDSVNLEGEFRSNQKFLNITGISRGMVYNNIRFDSLNLSARSDAEQFTYLVTLRSIYDSGYVLQHPALFGSARNDSINAFVKFGRDPENPSMYLGGSLTQQDSNYKFHVNPNRLIIAGEQWQAPDDNYVSFGTKGYYAHNFQLSNDTSFVLVNSSKELPNAPMEATFKQFNLGKILSSLVDTSKKVSGVVNGTVLIKDFKTFGFTSNITVDDLGYKRTQFGNLSLVANNEGANQYNVNLKLQGMRNGLLVDGSYRTGSADAIDFTVKMDSLNITLLEPFLSAYVKNMKGGMKGNFKITGSAALPAIRGSAQFDSAAVQLVATNAPLLFGDEPITFDETGIHFHELTLYDYYNHTGSVDGDMFTTDYKDYKFALDIITENFMAISASKKINPLFFGILNLDSKTTIRGDLLRIKIDTRARIREGTNLIYALSNADTTINSEQGIVEFVNVGSQLDSLLAIRKDTVIKSFTGLDITAAIDVDDSAKFKVVVDADAGDKLTVQGHGSLNYDLNPSGKMSLTGRFEVLRGNYSLTLYNFLKRDFQVKPGGSISWSGDPMNADIDLTATYTSRTSPSALLEEGVSSGQEAVPQYSQELDFEVDLNLKGSMLHPGLSFGIDLPVNQRGAAGGAVYQKLSQLNSPSYEPELNKQVFALLVLNSFIPADPFASSGGGSGGGYVENFARKSASQLLTSQLNRLSSSFVKGVNLNFNLNSYNDVTATGTQAVTTLDVGLRKNLFNNRLQFYVGSHFPINGTQQSGSAGTLNGDFSLEYLITSDGRFRTSVFSRQDYGDIFEGQVLETGGTFTFTKDYNKLADLFRKQVAEDASIYKKKKKEAIQQP
ncbi:MAG: translocation/assembly module TamB [Chitinophagales bacterium]|nr:translocation/assembly module TamB [Chitinophagales bacterium]